jgi:glycosyltransferase involved in cell wall biosynthesis
MSNPTVSVVIPLFDPGRFVGDALESVLAQDPAPVEIIVVDDGSTDEGPAVVAGFGPPVRLITQQHRGIAAARNRGVAGASGEYLAFLDDDDRMAAGSLRARVAILERDPDLDGVFGEVEEFADPAFGGAGVRRPRGRRWARMAGTLVIRRRAFSRVGPFRQDATRAEFVDWAIRAADCGLRFGVAPVLALHRRLHRDSTGMRERGQEAAYARAIKRSLDRRRAAGR